MSYEANNMCKKSTSTLYVYIVKKPFYMIIILKGNFFDFHTLFNTASYAAPPPRFHCVGGCWDRTQDCCDFGVGCQTLQPLVLFSSTKAGSHPLVNTMWKNDFEAPCTRLFKTPCKWGTTEHPVGRILHHPVDRIMVCDQQAGRAGDQARHLA